MSAEEFPPALQESVEALSRLVTADETMESTIGRIAELAVEAIPTMDICSISLAIDGKIKTVGATDPRAALIDEIQYETGEGPCLSAIEKHATFYIADMSADETWPKFSRRAAKETGVNSLLSYVLRVHESALGAVNMMSEQNDAFDANDQTAGVLFAAQAGVALANAVTHREDQIKIQQLEAGMESRSVIGEAIGLLMASRKCTKEEAFTILTEISQKSNIKLKEIASRLVDAAPDILS